MPQTESANNSGKIQPSIAQYFSGRSMPSIETFANICAVLDLDANKILCLDQFNRDIKITENTVNGEIKNKRIKTHRLNNELTTDFLSKSFFSRFG